MRLIALFFISFLLITGTAMASVQTDFIRACKNGDLEKAKELLDNGASPEGVDSVLGWSGLHWATFEGNTNLVKFLLIKGADYKAKDVNGLTPYDIALSNNNREMINIYQTLAVVDVDEKIPSGKGISVLIL